MIKSIILLNKLKFVVLLSFVLSVVSCTNEDQGCETETVCFGDGNCIEKPIPGTCFDQ